MKLDPDHDLSPEAIAALRDLLAQPEPIEPEADEESLRSFVLGLASEPEKQAIVKTLVRSKALRGRLATIQRELQTLAGSPGWQRSVDSASMEIQAGLRSVLGLDVEMSGWDVAPDWGALDERGVGVAVKSILAAIGQNLQVSLGMPRFATMRRGGSGMGQNFPDGIQGEFFAEVREDGALVVDARFHARDASASSIDGRSVRLDLLDPAGGIFPLTTATVKSLEARFVLDGFGAVTGIEAASLPNEIFQIAFGDSAAPTDGLSYLFIESEDGPIAGAILEPFRVEGDVLRLSLELPDFVRERFRNGTLEFYARLGGVELLLKSYALIDLAEGPLSVHIPVPNIGRGRTLYGSTIRARISPAHRPERK